MTGSALSTPCRIGLWGTFDLPGFDGLIPRVLRRELAQRLPAAQVHAAAPYGRLRPTPRDGGEPAEPLGPWSPEGALRQAAQLDCIFVAGAELLPDQQSLALAYGVDDDSIRALAPDRFFTDGPGAQAEQHCPMAWLGVTLAADPTPEEAQRLRAAAARRSYISVTDSATRQRLLDALGSDPNIEVVPDLALLAPRLHPPELLAKRLDYLHLMGWFPREGTPLVVEGDASLMPHVPALAAALAAVLERHPEVVIVLAEMGSVGDRGLAEALERALPGGRTTRLPGCAGLEDLSAALAACSAFAGSSYRAGLLAFAYDRPLAILNLAGAAHSGQLEGLAQLVGIDGCLVHAPEGLPRVLELALAAEAAPRGAFLSPQRSGPTAPARSGPHTSRLAALIRQVDDSLDAVAALAASATLLRARPGPSTGAEQLIDLDAQLHQLEVAHDARSRRLATERMVFANQLHKAEAEITRLKREAAQLREEAESAHRAAAQAEAAAADSAAAAAAADAELRGLRATRTFRYTAELRNLYGHLRGGPADPPQQ